MKRIIVFILFIISLSFIFIPVSAEEEMDSSYGINKVIDSSTTTFMLIDDVKFNYVYSRIEKLDKLSNDIYDLAYDVIIPEVDLIIKYDLGNNTYLIYEYCIRNKNGEYLNIYIMDNLFIQIKGDDSSLNKVYYQDLREYGDIFSFDKNKYTLEYKSKYDIDIEGLSTIFNRLIDKIGFKYLEGILVNESNYGNVFLVNNGPHIMDVICYGDISDTHIEECISDGEEYNYNKPVGNYHFYVYHLKYSGILDVLNVHICITDFDSLYCDEINVSYMKYLSLKKYKNNYIHGPDYYIDKNKYVVNCDYFYGSDKVIGKHIVNVKYTLDNFDIYGSGIINVIDDVNPYFVGDEEIIGYKSKLNIDLKSIFKDVKALDEIDGDITNKIKIDDLDNYENNLGIVGKYKFKLSVEDNSGNKIDKIFVYKIVDDTIIEEPTIDDNPIEDNIIEDNSVEEIVDDNNDELIEENEIEEKIEEEVKKKQLIPIVINTSINNKLDINKIKERLIFNGVISDEYNGEINTNYIGNENNIGEYEIILEGIDEYNIKIIVKDENKIIEDKYNPTWIIIGSIIGVIIVIIFIVVLKKKLNKR